MDEYLRAINTQTTEIVACKGSRTKKRKTNNSGLDAWWKFDEANRLDWSPKLDTFDHTSPEHVIENRYQEAVSIRAS